MMVARFTQVIARKAKASFELHKGAIAMPREASQLMPFRCLRALDKIEALLAHARTDVIDLVEMIQDACDEALSPAIAAGTQSAETNEDLAQSEGCQSGAKAHRPNSVGHLLHKRSD